MVRQYVGARYVPKFATPVEWAADTSYEALTIVTFNNASYTSKIQVPPTVGNPANNPKYWALTGNYNAQVEEYRQEVNSAVNSVNDAIQSLRAETNTEIENAVNSVNGAIQSLKSEINTEIENAKQRGRNFILIGDSFGGGVDGNNNSQAVEGGGWIDRFKTTVRGYCNVYNNQVPLGGVYGFASSRPFLDVLKDAEKTITDKTTITDIIVLGGTNDIANVSGIPKAIEDFCNYCHTNYKNANVGIGLIGTLTYEFVNNGVYSAYKTCVNHGAYFINSTMMLYSWKKYLGADGTHLTKAGYEFYQPYVNQAILTGRCHYDWHGLVRSTTPITGEATTASYYSSYAIHITPDTTTYKQLMARYGSMDGLDINDTVKSINTPGPTNLKAVNTISNLITHLPLLAGPIYYIYANVNNDLRLWFTGFCFVNNNVIGGDVSEIIAANTVDAASQPSCTVCTEVPYTASNYLTQAEQ